MEDTDRTNEPYNYVPLFASKKLVALVCYNLHLCKALVHYNKQLLDNVEFGCYIHTLSCVALSRIAYMQAMLRSVQCRIFLRASTTNEKEQVFTTVLESYYRRIKMQKHQLAHKCEATRIWSANVNESGADVRCLPQYGAYVRPSVEGVQPSFIDLRSLYRVCSKTWDNLHRCQMHLDLCTKL